MTSKVENLQLAAGDVVETITPGGGGRGDPRQRNPERMAYDASNEYVIEAKL